jgi:hypothetical protein
VLSFRGREIAQIDAFVTRAAEAPDRAAYARWPEQDTAPAQLEALFERFGLPARPD